MYRKAYEELLSWKEKKNRKPLILRGARQVGKTWLLKHFGAEQYESVAYFNLENSQKLTKVFELDLDPQRIVRTLESISNEKITPGKTLIILDEIQSIPRALTSLKYFCEDAPEYHIAVAGSLLGIALHPGTSFPVGKVDFIDILPMNFYEYLKATGEDGMAKIINDRQSLSETTIFHDNLIRHLKNYMVIGGMPEAVKTYIDGGTFATVREVQENIINSYEVDFSKHAPNTEAPKIRDIYDTMATCLSRENKKFIFSAIRKSARAREYEAALLWLEDTGLATKVERIEGVKLPLKAYANRNIFKLFFSDIGLLGAKMELDPQIILNSDDLYEEYKGAFAEQFAFQEMKAAGKTTFYYSDESTRNEVDFIVQDEENGVLPIEVKSGQNLKSTSFNNFLNKYRLNKGVKLSILPYKENDVIINMPLYLAGII